MERFYLTKVIVTIASLYGAVAPRPGKDPCVGHNLLYEPCDMLLWSGTCQYAYDKDRIAGHQLCIPWCDISELVLPDNVVLEPTSDTGANIGVAVNVMCEDGFSPAPGSTMTITCINGIFSDFCGECLRDCGEFDPALIDPGAIIVSETGHLDRDVVTLDCNGSLVASGSMGAYCDNGTWQFTEDAQCLIPCPNPPGITFTNMDLTTTIEEVDFTDGHVLEFECDANHAATGCNYAVCLANGTWDVTDNGGCLPTCPNPPGITFTNMNLTTSIAAVDFTAGDVIEFECDADHAANGCNYAVCLANGTWDVTDHGGCLPACPNPPGITFTNMDLTTTIAGVDFIAGHVLEFECDADHAANGCSYAVCLANGTWDVTDHGGCLPVCPNPPGITFTNMNLTTTIEGVDFIAGQVLEFECDANHVANGCNYAVCLANGTWDVTNNGGCLPACPNPPGVTFDNMVLTTPTEGATFSAGDVLLFECILSNYSASACNYAVCLSDGTWDEFDNGGCSADCAFPPPLVGDVSGAIAGPDVDGYTATYTCDTSFTVHDEAIYECTDTGWVEVQACASVYTECSATLSDLLPSNLNKCRYYNGKCYCPVESERTYNQAREYCDGLSDISGVDATLVVVDDFYEYRFLWVYGDKVINGVNIWWLSIRSDDTGVPYNDYSPYDPPPYAGHFDYATYAANECAHFNTDSDNGDIDNAWLFESCVEPRLKKKSICEIADPYQ